jgi:hypothetical protein
MGDLHGWVSPQWKATLVEVIKTFDTSYVSQWFIAVAWRIWFSFTLGPLTGYFKERPRFLLFWNVSQRKLVVSEIWKTCCSHLQVRQFKKFFLGISEPWIWEWQVIPKRRYLRIVFCLAHGPLTGYFKEIPRFCPFWDVTQRRLAVTDVSGRSIDPISKSSNPRKKFFLNSALAYGIDRFSRNGGDYDSTLRNIPEERQSRLHSAGRVKSPKRRRFLLKQTRLLYTVIYRISVASGAAGIRPSRNVVPQSRKSRDCTGRHIPVDKINYS